MKVYQSFEWSLFYVLECKSAQIHGFAEFFLQIVCYRTGSIYRYMRRVLAQITGDETFETVHYQFVYGRFLAELYEYGGETALLKTVGDLVLYDENPFSRAAAAGKSSVFLRSAFAEDVKTLFSAAEKAEERSGGKYFCSGERKSKLHSKAITKNLRPY